MTIYVATFTGMLLTLLAGEIGGRKGAGAEAGVDGVSFSEIFSTYENIFWPCLACAMPFVFMSVSSGWLFTVTAIFSRCGLKTPGTALHTKKNQKVRICK